MELPSSSVCKPESELSYELTKCKNRLAELENKIDNLSQALKPLLRCEEPAGSAGCAVAEEPRTLIGKNIRQLTDKIAMEMDLIDDLINRLEV